MYMELPKKTSIHLWISLGTTCLPLPLLPEFSLQGPPLPTSLTSTTCHGLCCLQQHLPPDLPPRVTFLPLTWTLPSRPLPSKVQLVHLGHHQRCQSRQGHDSSQSPVNRKENSHFLCITFRRGSPTAWVLGLDYYKVYWNTCLHTQLLFFKEWTNATRVAGTEDSIRDTTLHVLDTTPWVWLPGHISLLIPYSKFSLQESAFSPHFSHIPYHLPCKYVHIWIPCKIGFWEQLTPPMLISCYK